MDKILEHRVPFVGVEPFFEEEDGFSVKNYQQLGEYDF
jgi:hypothetical protein